MSWCCSATEAARITSNLTWSVRRVKKVFPARRKSSNAGWEIQHPKIENPIKEWEMMQHRNYARTTKITMVRNWTETISFNQFFWFFKEFCYNEINVKEPKNSIRQIERFVCKWPTLAETICQRTAIHFCGRRISHSSLCQLQHPKNWWVWETLPNKPSAGHYKIDYKVNKVYFQLSLNLLSDIFKQCFNEENFPSFCKLAKLEKMTLLKCTKWTDTVPHKFLTDKMKREVCNLYGWRQQLGSYDYWFKKLSIWLSEIDSQSVLNVLLVYRRPNTKLSVFMEKFEKILEVTKNGGDIQFSADFFNLDTEIETVEILKSSVIHQIIRIIPVQY